jgi:hypothetical protein
MNIVLLIIFGGGLCFACWLLGGTSRSVIVATAVLIFAGIAGIFAFRVIFELFFPDPPHRMISDDDDWE